MTKRAYVAPADLEEELARELGKSAEQYGRLFLRSGTLDSVWAQNTWLETTRVEFASIREAAEILKGVQRNWAHFPVAAHRRAALIREQLPHVSAKELAFPAPVPRSPIGGWSLLESNVLVYSASTSSPFPNGEPRFVEDKKAPPSRAYLKLWEALTLFGKRPSKGERCYDLGAAPGGWTWVLAALGARVTAFDRSPLDPSLMKHPNVEHVRGDAFRLGVPKEPIDWLLSDMACYPEKLYEWVRPLVEKKAARNFICTLKFQGKSSSAIIEKFRRLPGSRVLHLFNNKHELTWCNLSES